MSGFAAFLVIALTSICAFAASESGNDLVIKTRTTSTYTSGGETRAGRTHWLTIYIRGDRQRREELWEAMGPAPRSSNVVIFQCDLKRTLFLEEQARTYAIQSILDRGEYMKKRDSDLKSGKIKPIAIDPAAGVVSVKIETMDTGERKEVGGIVVARHIKEVRTQEVSPGSPVTGNSRLERDGWYIDIPYGCQSKQLSGTHIATGATLITFARPAGVGHPKIDVTHTGNTAPVRGIPVMETSIDTTPSGSTTETVELIEISLGSVNPALFEIPRNYHPALRLPRGGFDLKRPDTPLNRLIAWWGRLWESWRAWRTAWTRG